MAFINVEHVSKDYLVHARPKRMVDNIKSLFHREHIVKQAVKDISFHIDAGETVGYIGMNGAGKSTTIKMLSGILTPDKGSITVGGIVPYENRKANARQMGVVFGQRSRLNWDLPMADTFELYKQLYNIDDARYRRNYDYYVELLGMKEFMDRPIRQLSLGEKMRANIAAALLHDPSVVYLDEPTIGLDVVAKRRIREFINEINRERGVTVMLTTHDMKDIEEICRRIIFIHKGEIFFDGPIDTFRSLYGSGYKITVGSPDALSCEGLKLTSQKDGRYIFSGDKRSLSPEAAFSRLVNQGKIITSINVEEATMEDIVMSIVESR